MHGMHTPFSIPVNTKWLYNNITNACMIYIKNASYNIGFACSSSDLPEATKEPLTENAPSTALSLGLM